MRLPNDPREVMATQRAIEVWNEISQDLWSHLQIEDELVFSWGKGTYRDFRYLARYREERT
jgi:hypothetical protein